MKLIVRREYIFEISKQNLIYVFYFLKKEREGGILEEKFKNW